MFPLKFAKTSPGGAGSLVDPQPEIDLVVNALNDYHLFGATALARKDTWGNTVSHFVEGMGTVTGEPAAIAHFVRDMMLTYGANYWQFVRGITCLCLTDIEHYGYFWQYQMNNDQHVWLDDPTPPDIGAVVNGAFDAFGFNCDGVIDGFNTDVFYSPSPAHADMAVPYDPTPEDLFVGIYLSKYVEDQANTNTLGATSISNVYLFQLEEGVARAQISARGMVRVSGGATNVVSTADNLGFMAPNWYGIGSDGALNRQSLIVAGDIVDEIDGTSVIEFPNTQAITIGAENNQVTIVRAIEGAVSMVMHGTSGLKAAAVGRAVQKFMFNLGIVGAFPPEPVPPLMLWAGWKGSDTNTPALTIANFIANMEERCTADAFADMKHIGAHYSNDFLSWYQIEGAGSGETSGAWDWGILDHIENAINDPTNEITFSHFTIAHIGAPGILFPDDLTTGGAGSGGDPTDIENPDAAVRWGKFCAAFGARYAGLYDWISIGNEINIAVFAPTAAQEVGMKACYDAGEAALRPHFPNAEIGIQIAWHHMQTWSKEANMTFYRTMSDVITWNYYAPHADGGYQFDNVQVDLDQMMAMSIETQAFRKQAVLEIDCTYVAVFTGGAVPNADFYNKQVVQFAMRWANKLEFIGMGFNLHNYPNWYLEDVHGPDPVSPPIDQDWKDWNRALGLAWNESTDVPGQGSFAIDINAGGIGWDTVGRLYGYPARDGLTRV